MGFRLYFFADHTFFPFILAPKLRALAIASGCSRHSFSVKWGYGSGVRSTSLSVHECAYVCAYGAFEIDAWVS